LISPPVTKYSCHLVSTKTSEEEESQIYYVDPGML